ncbi:MAG: iron-sulfur cluster assembly accessory protein [Chloroflexi bacterium]|nr:iron-sulfur cluster assembly accessory protein [Chloroflexota bacterium]
MDRIMVAITERASAQLKEILANVAAQRGKEDLGLRIFIEGQCGCGNVHYGLGIDDQAREGDAVVETQGVKVLIDPDTAETVEGAEIDYTDELMRKGFTISNPNRVGGCNCGGHH